MGRSVSPAVQRSDDLDRELLPQLEAERASAQEHASRMAQHLSREIAYGYPPAQIRPLRRMVSDAVSKYVYACEGVDRVARRIRKRQETPSVAKGGRP